MAKKDFIKERYIYYIQFDPVENGEFGSHHLALVLKINKDRKSALVIPLTSAETNCHYKPISNKICIGILSNLPQRLKSKPTYAVLDHARNVSFNRFSPIREGEIMMDKEIFDTIMFDYLNMLTNILNQSDQKNFHFTRFEDLIIKEIVNHAHSINKKQCESGHDIDTISSLKEDMRKLIDISINLEKIPDLSPAIAQIIDDVFNPLASEIIAELSN